MEDNPTSQDWPRLGTTWTAALKGVSEWAQRAVRSRRVRRLRVRETLSLGDKRFLAVVEFDRQEFLVGGSGNSLTLLARLQEGMVVPEPPLPAVARVA
jgi:flagellar biogenesis protein FliO